jgi:hypothetical protein
MRSSRRLCSMHAFRSTFEALFIRAAMPVLARLIDQAGREQLARSKSLSQAS